MKSDAGPLCSTWFDPRGRLRLPFGARVGFALYLKGPSFAVPPVRPLSGSPPLAGSALGRSAPGAPLPGRWGSPLFVFVPPSFSSVSVSVLLKGHAVGFGLRAGAKVKARLLGGLAQALAH